MSLRTPLRGALPGQRYDEQPREHIPVFAALSFASRWPLKSRLPDEVAVLSSGALLIPWLAVFRASLRNYGRRGLWLLIGAPLVLFWPVVFLLLCLSCLVPASTACSLRRVGSSAVLSVTSGHAGSFATGQNGATCEITVSSLYGANTTSGTVRRLRWSPTATTARSAARCNSRTPACMTVS